MGRNSRRAFISEALESRCLLSASPGSTVTEQVVAVAGGNQLQVIGTNHADTITLNQTGSGIVVDDGSSKKTFTGKYVSLWVDGYDGNDTLRVTNNVTLPVSMYAGDGTDNLFDAGKGADSVHAGTGRDLLVTIGGGADNVYGGSGFDSFWVGTGDTLHDVTSAETSADSVHKVSSFYQPFTTNPSSANFVSTEIASQTFTEPTPTSSSYKYESFNNDPLFSSGGPAYNDAKQGEVGDCYLISSLASIAFQHPTRIEETIAPLGDGTYAVRFYNKGSAVYVRIDGTLPTSSGHLVYAQLGAQSSTWTALIEKAYAFFGHGDHDYSSISGGWMGTVYSQITNAAVSGISTSGSSTTLAKAVAAALAANHPVTAGTPSHVTSPLVGDHAYMVKSIATDSKNNTTVTLYNPWGSLVTVSLAEFQKYMIVCVSDI